MTFAEKLLALALLAQVLVTILVLFQLGARRYDAYKGRRARGNLLLDSSGWPDDVRKVQNNFANQFETPVLFYALALLALVIKAASLPFAVLAWIYVATRVVHNRIHTGRNTLPLRGGSFLVGVAVLIAMLAMLAIAILSNGLF
jgi:hypothetical protein